MIRYYLIFPFYLSFILVTASFCLAEENLDSFESDSAFEFEDEFAEEEAETYDPLIGFNKLMFKVNDKLYFWILNPVGSTYGVLIPEKARASVEKFFLNLEFPIRFVNNILQIKLKNAGIELTRFGINSTIGILGFMDPAYTWMHLSPRDEDFGQTLGFYGIGEGFPLVLPILGVTNLRDSIAEVPDSFLSPIHYLQNLFVRISVIAFDKVNYVSLHVGEYEMIKKEAIDPYTFTRDAYAQIRKKRIEE